MTDQPHAPAQNTSIEDNYAEYLDDEFGYAYGFADALTQHEIARHHALRIADAHDLDALANTGLSQLPALDLLAITHAFQRLGDLANTILTGELLLAAEDTDARIDYAEVSRHIADLHLRRGHPERAQAQLHTHLHRWPDDLQAQQLSALTEFLAAHSTPETLATPGAADSAKAAPDTGAQTALHAFAARFAQDAELRLEIAEDLARFGHLGPALLWLDDARTLARAHDPATLVDVELLAARLTQPKAAQP